MISKRDFDELNICSPVCMNTADFSFACKLFCALTELNGGNAFYRGQRIHARAQTNGRRAGQLQLRGEARRRVGLGRRLRSWSGSRLRGRRRKLGRQLRKECENTVGRSSPYLVMVRSVHEMLDTFKNLWGYQVSR